MEQPKNNFKIVSDKKVGQKTIAGETLLAKK